MKDPAFLVAPIKQLTIVCLFALEEIFAAKATSRLSNGILPIILCRVNHAALKNPVMKHFKQVKIIVIFHSRKNGE